MTNLIVKILILNKCTVDCGYTVEYIKNKIIGVYDNDADLERKIAEIFDDLHHKEIEYSIIPFEMNSP